MQPSANEDTITIIPRRDIPLLNRMGPYLSIFIFAIGLVATRAFKEGTPLSVEILADCIVLAMTGTLMAFAANAFTLEVILDRQGIRYKTFMRREIVIPYDKIHSAVITDDGLDARQSNTFHNLPTSARLWTLHIKTHDRKKYSFTTFALSSGQLRQIQSRIMQASPKIIVEQPNPQWLVKTYNLLPYIVVSFFLVLIGGYIAFECYRGNYPSLHDADGDRISWHQFVQNIR